MSAFMHSQPSAVLPKFVTVNEQPIFVGNYKLSITASAFVIWRQAGNKRFIRKTRT